MTRLRLPYHVCFDPVYQGSEPGLEILVPGKWDGRLSNTSVHPFVGPPDSDAVSLDVAADDLRVSAMRVLCRFAWR